MSQSTLPTATIESNIAELNNALSFAGASQSMRATVLDAEWTWLPGAVYHLGGGEAHAGETEEEQGGLTLPFITEEGVPNQFSTAAHTFKFHDAAGLLLISGTLHERGFKLYLTLKEKKD